jgi:hypothetical protein
MVSPGERLTFDETRFRTTKPGRLQVIAPTSVTGRRLGSIQALSRGAYYSGKFADVTVKLNAGDTIDYLQYRSSGSARHQAWRPRDRVLSELDLRPKLHLTGGADDARDLTGIFHASR